MVLIRILKFIIFFSFLFNSNLIIIIIIIRSGKKSSIYLNSKFIVPVVNCANLYEDIWKKKI